jgi:hypothetical protein
MAPQQQDLDRLSLLPDAALVRVLSHLPTDQAVRTSALSRRWRRVFTTVPVVDLRQVDFQRRPRDKDDELPVCFDHVVTSALLSRDPTAPIRAFRLAADDRPYYTVKVLMDQWVTLAMSAGTEELDLDLSPMFAGTEDLDLDLSHMGRCTEHLCPYRAPAYHQMYDLMSSEEQFLNGLFYTVSSSVFRQAALHHLRLADCKIAGLPATLPLGSLETLSLRRMNAPDGTLERLVSCCPRLSDLLLEECPTLKRVTLPTAAPLRSFTLRCCHNIETVAVAAAALRSVEYRGTARRTSFLLLRDSAAKALTIDICDRIDSDDPDRMRRLRELVQGCPDLSFLHLSSRMALACFSRSFSRGLRSLHGLQQLELRGKITNGDDIRALANMLDNTCDLEVLTIFLGETNEDHDPDQRISVPSALHHTSIRCLRSTLREINLVKYMGRVAERRLAKYLLCEGVCLQELCITFADSVSERSQVRMLKEMAPWRSNPRSRITSRYK